MIRPSSMILAGMVLLSAAGTALPNDVFWPPPPPTWREDIQVARLILFGTVTHSEVNPADGKGNSTFRIDTVIKSDPWLDNKATITIPHFLPPKSKFVVLCDIYKDKLDVYRVVDVKSDAAVAYFKGLLDADAKGTADVLRFCFDYLEHAEPELARNAFEELSKADDRDIAKVARRFSAEKLRGFLMNPKTPAEHHDLYAWLLAQCGKREDAKLLRVLLDKEKTSGGPRFLAGYVLLQPKEGWKYVRGILSDDRKDFSRRYPAWQAARTFHDSWPGVIPPADVVAAVSPLLNQPDIADLAIDDLRRWGCWNMTEKILALYDRKSYDEPINRRSIVRFALCAADRKLHRPNPKAIVFVAKLRKRNAKMVEEAEAWLRQEKQDKPAGK